MQEFERIKILFVAGFGPIVRDRRVELLWRVTRGHYFLHRKRRLASTVKLQETVERVRRSSP
jgi:hypothetical protein